MLKNKIQETVMDNVSWVEAKKMRKEILKEAEDNQL